MRNVVLTFEHNSISCCEKCHFEYHVEFEIIFQLIETVRWRKKMLTDKTKCVRTQGKDGRKI